MILLTSAGRSIYTLLNMNLTASTYFAVSVHEKIAHDAQDVVRNEEIPVEKENHF